MTALAFNQQIDNHGRSAGERSVAAGCRGYRPAGMHERQDTRREPGGFLLNNGSSLTRGFIVVPPKTRPALRGRHFSRVGWCFNTARDFIEFDRLTKSGVHPLHAIAAMSPVLPAGQTVTIQPGLTKPPKGDAKCRT